MIVRRLLTAVFALTLALAGATAAPPRAIAHPLPHGDQALIVNLRPAPGTLVLPGTVRIAALAATDAPLTAHQVLVDGRTVPSQATSGDHATITATVQVDEPGAHAIEVVATTSAGEARRSWRFDVSEVDWERLSGPTRIETATAISRARFPQDGSAAGALVAVSEDWQMALAAAPLAAAAQAPLLLSGPDALATSTRDELVRALPDGATVTLLGGLTEAVAEDVRALGFAVERIAGADVWSSSAQVARRLLPAGTALVASGETFADALSVSSPAAARGYPIVLTAADTLPDATRAVLSEGGFATVLVIGGPAAVGEGVVEDIRASVGGGTEVVRIAGPTRYDTAKAVAQTFFPSYEAVAVASGERFPDALAGGPHAGELGAPLLLVPGDAAAAPQQQQMVEQRPATGAVYGGTSAVGHRALAELAEAATDAAAPGVVAFTPREGEQISTLDEVRVELEREVVPEASSIYVTLAGQEVPGTLSTGDFASTLVYTVSDLPPGVAAGATYPVEVTVAADDGEATQHVRRSLAYHKPLRTLSRGDEGAQVRELEERLSALRYWVGPVDGVYDDLTHQAVLAFQKVNGLARDGVFGPNTRAALQSPVAPQPRSSSGLVVEVDKTDQVVLVVVDGQVAHIFNSATGTEEPYTYEGETYIADTPPGSFEIFRQIDGWRESHLGRLYRPKYFNGGIALHGSTSVPAYPASHGCVRVSIAAMDFLWDRLPIGTDVLVYGQVA